MGSPMSLMTKLRLRKVKGFPQDCPARSCLSRDLNLVLPEAKSHILNLYTLDTAPILILVDLRWKYL